MRPIADLFPLILPHVPGCPEPTAAIAARAAAAEFCERTRCWRVVADVAVTAQAPGVSLPAYAAIHEIEMARWEGQPLERISYMDALSTWPAENWTADMGGQPHSITQAAPGALIVLPFGTGTLKLSIYVKPAVLPRFGPGLTIDTTLISVDTTEVNLSQAPNRLEELFVLPDFMFDQIAEPLAWGALSRIFAIPGQPFSDAGLALAYADRFAKAIDSRSTSNLRGQQRTPLRTRPRFF